MGLHEHRREGRRPVACAVITLSDTRTIGTDESGRLIRTLLEEAGHQVLHAGIVPDDPRRLREELDPLLSRPELEAVLLNGGTGIAGRDLTFEAIEVLFDRSLPGFGEIFRALSFAEIGPAAMLSRAAAGVAKGKVVFSMPGSPAAVRLAMERLILPELGHAVAEARRA